MTPRPDLDALKRLGDDAEVFDARYAYVSGKKINRLWSHYIRLYNYAEGLILYIERLKRALDEQGPGG